MYPTFTPPVVQHDLGHGKLFWKEHLDSPAIIMEKLCGYMCHGFIIVKC